MFNYRIKINNLIKVVYELIFECELQRPKYKKLLNGCMESD